MTNKPRKPSRRRARKLALQALYQWQFNENSPRLIVADMTKDLDPTQIDIEYFTDLVQGAVENLDKIDSVVAPHLDRPLLEVSPIELVVLRFATYELLERHDIPYRVVINEALELTKKFGAEDSYKYVNAILDKIAPQLRPNG